MGLVTADDGSTYTTLTAWESAVGTVGGPGGTCTLSGSFDDGGIILDFTNNSLEDIDATFCYVIKGAAGTTFSPTTTNPLGIIHIITETIMMDVTLSGLTARENEEWYDVGLNIAPAADASASLYRIKAIGMGEIGGSDAVGFQLDEQNYSDITIWGCYATDIVHSGGFNAYGMSAKQGTPPNSTNKPTINISYCTVDSIRSYNDTGIETNEAIGFYVSDASGYTITHCVSHGISAANDVLGGDSFAGCYAPGLWPEEARVNYPLPQSRGSRSENQSSDRTGYYVGIEDEINLYTGPNERPFPLPGEARGIYNRRPDPAASGFFNCGNRIHDLKIAPGTPNGMQLNYTHGAGSIGAFGKYVVTSVGTASYRKYSSISTALISIKSNPEYGGGVGDTGYYRSGQGYMLGHQSFAHAGPTYMILQFYADGDYAEQLRSADIPDVIGWLNPLADVEGWVFTGRKNYRAKIRPGYEGYSDILFDAGDHLVQHLEIDAESYGWSVGIRANQVHDCIVHGNKWWAASESIDTGIVAHKNIEGYNQIGGLASTSLVYGTIKNGINAECAYCNTVVLNNMSLDGVGIDSDVVSKNNLVLTSGINFLGIQYQGSGNIGASRNRVNDYFTDAADDDYTLKVNSLAIDRGVIPTVNGDYGAGSSRFLPIWPYEAGWGSGLYTDRWDVNHWFLDGDSGANRFFVSVSQSTFDTGWDESQHGEYIAPQAPFIAFMDF